MSVPYQKNFTFRNWAHNVSSRPEKYFQPQTETELIAIVQEAAAAEKRVRVTGARHSWSAIACTDDYLLNLDAYNRVLHVNRGKKQIRAQAGIRLKELNRALEANGLSLINLGSVSAQSIAGAISTGTHGTGIQYPMIAASVTGMRIITAGGLAMEITKDDPLLDAFRVSLGLLGIVSEVTIQCCDFFHLEENAAPVVFEDALAQLPELLRNTDHPKFWWFPHVDEMMVYRYSRTHQPLKPFSPALEWFNESFMVRTLFALFLSAGKQFPQWIPRINNIIKAIHFKKIFRVDKSYKVFNVPMPPRHRETEYAVPVEKAGAALAALKSEIERLRLKVNFVVEVRFVKGDNIWLSPAYQRDSCYIGAYQYGDAIWQPYMEMFETLMQRFDGRPHWGKEFSPALHDFHKHYPRLNEFIELKNRLDKKKHVRQHVVG